MKKNQQIFTYDDAAQAVYLGGRKGKVAKTQKGGSPGIFIDYDNKGRVIGVEVLLDVFKKANRQSVRKFIHDIGKQKITA